MKYKKLLFFFITCAFLVTSGYLIKAKLTKELTKKPPTLIQKSQTEKENKVYSLFNKKLKPSNSDPFKINTLNKKVIILDFWATWCPPCVAEIPHFVTLQEKYPTIQVIGISLDQEASALPPFITEKRINYPIIHADPKIMNIVQKDFGYINSIPTTFVFDEQKKLITKVVGYRDLSFFEEIILSQ